MSDSGKSQPPPTSTTYMVGGNVTGLSGNGLMLELNGGSDIPVESNGAFTFPGSLSSGTQYNVIIKDQPAVRREICTVTNGAGTVGMADIGNVSINCVVAVGFVYVVDPNSQIGAYGITPGTGAPIPDGSFSIPTASVYQAMVAAPSGNFLYVLGQEPSQISTFAIDPDQGALTPVNGLVDIGPGGATSMVMSPSGSFLFVESTDTLSESVQTFKVDAATGALTPGVILQRSISCIPGACAGAGRFVVGSDSRYLYRLDLDLANNTGSVTPYAIDPVTGALTAGTAVSFAANAANTDGTSMAIDTLGRFLYVATSAGVPLMDTSATVATYMIDPKSGALSPGSTSSVANGAFLMVPDPTGRYLYSIYWGGDQLISNILSLAVDPSSGALSQIGPAVPIAVTTDVAACDPSGGFLFLGAGGGAPFTGNLGGNDLTSFTIATGGVSPGAVSLSGEGMHIPVESGSTPPGGSALAIVE
ncbi:MAG TPA: beta-propeller fold lactonase family protein [Steroidobacteraceae bacterium]|nr:beta-propeller fold lactonase family protein [Steroidobacteraceae bacterium]